MEDYEIEDSVKKLFQKYYKKHGNDIKSMAWKSEEENKRRFGVLKEIGIKVNDSVLDVGCGFGDFVHYSINKYLGIDIVPEFIQIARKKYGFADIRFRTCTIDDIHEKFDWVISAGAFGYKAVTDEYIKRTMRKAFDKCKKGIAFNFTTTYVNYHDSVNHYTDPTELFDWARKYLSKYIVIRHDYLPYEFVIYVYKEINS